MRTLGIGHLVRAVAALGAVPADLEFGEEEALGLEVGGVAAGVVQVPRPLVVDPQGQGHDFRVVEGAVDVAGEHLQDLRVLDDPERELGVVQVVHQEEEVHVGPQGVLHEELFLELRHTWRWIGLAKPPIGSDQALFIRGMGSLGTHPKTILTQNLAEGNQV